MKKFLLIFSMICLVAVLAVVLFVDWSSKNDVTSDDSLIVNTIDSKLLKLSSTRTSSDEITLNVTYVGILSENLGWTLSYKDGTSLSLVNEYVSVTTNGTSAVVKFLKHFSQQMELRVFLPSDLSIYAICTIDCNPLFEGINFSWILEDGVTGDSLTPIIHDSFSDPNYNGEFYIEWDKETDVASILNSYQYREFNVMPILSNSSYLPNFEYESRIEIEGEFYDCARNFGVDIYNTSTLMSSDAISILDVLNNTFIEDPSDYVTDFRDLPVNVLQALREFSIEYECAKPFFNLVLDYNLFVNGNLLNTGEYCYKIYFPDLSVLTVSSLSFSTSSIVF